jgi:hypothetical protein
MARKFIRPEPGSNYTAEQRKAWGAEQDRLRAERAARVAIAQPKPPAKRATRAKTLTADTSGSSCFDALTYKNGVVRASFIGPASGTWEYEMSRADAKEWFDDASLGGFFNENVR